MSSAKIPYPQCDNCDFFHFNPDSDRSCDIHDFVMPRTGWQIICSDWRQKQEPSPRFRELESGKLYYYSISTGEVLKAVLKPFEELQKSILGVNIRQDKELGWIIYPHKQRRFFPSPGEQVIIMLGSVRFLFLVANADRALAQNMYPTEDGWETTYHTRKIFMLYCEKEPSILYRWANAHINFDEYISNSFVPSLFAFIEVLEPLRRYALRPDLLTYSQYR